MGFVVMNVDIGVAAAKLSPKSFIRNIAQIHILAGRQVSFPKLLYCCAALNLFNGPIPCNLGTPVWCEGAGCCCVDTRQQKLLGIDDFIGSDFFKSVFNCVAGNF
jgi:hypothetical protein